MATEWRVAFASVLGTSHCKTNVSCQDSSACRILRAANGEQVLVGVVSDGAGSASRSEVGSHLACNLFLNEIAALLEIGGEICEITRAFGAAWLTRFQNEVAARAGAEQVSPREFACTVLAAVVGESSSVFFQVGDGAIVVACPEEPEEFMWIFWPQKGEYENQTFFATEDNASERIKYTIIKGCVQEVALFTDGLQHLALHYQSQTVFSPLFRKLFAPLRPETEGISDRLSRALAAFLDSEKVNNRTDDDKTLILASRYPMFITEEADEAAAEDDSANGL